MTVNSRARGRVGALGVCAALCVAASAASAQSPQFTSTTPYVLSAAIKPPPGGKITNSFDIGWVDPVRKRYYLANRGTKSILVVDTTTNTLVGNFAPGFAGAVGTPVNNAISGPDGVLTTETELYVGDAPSRVWAMDPTTGAPNTAPISTSPTSPNRADEGCYDPIHNVVAFANNADDPPFLTFISTLNHSVLGQIVFDGKGGRPDASNGIEQCAFNPRDNRIYVTLPELSGDHINPNVLPGGVSVIDPETRTIVVTHSIPQDACTGPQGLVIGPSPPFSPQGQIGLGCNVGTIMGVSHANNAVINDNGVPLAKFPNQGGCDEAWYNPGNNKYFVACRQAPGGEALFIIDAGSFAVQRVFTGTASNAHSVASDPVSFAAYVPTSNLATSGLCSSKGAVDTDGCILVFSPATEPAASTHDFNHDFRSDILWRNVFSGAVVMWLMNGSTILSSNAVGLLTTDWNMVGQRDFNGDGFADILWRNDNGDVGMWLMNGSTIIADLPVGSLPTNWVVVGTGDFNGDGKGDILFRDMNSGGVAMWLMNGATIIAPSPCSPGSVPLDWEIAGVADVNGDAHADIIFHNKNSGGVVIWLMDGCKFISSTGIMSVPTNWVIAGTGDFDGNGKFDILWYDTMSGGVVATLMDATQGSGTPITWHPVVLMSVGVGSIAPNTNWTIVETGDFNADGTSDVLWYNHSPSPAAGGGALALWFIKGAAVASSAGVGSMPLDWHVQSMNAD